MSPSSRRLTLYAEDALPQVARALAQLVEQRRVERLAIEQLDGDAISSDAIAAFADTGFVRTPRGVRATPTTVAEVRDQLRASRRVRIGDIALPTHGRLPNDPMP
jgi:hypothetical protein